MGPRTFFGFFGDSFFVSAAATSEPLFWGFPPFILYPLDRVTSMPLRLIKSFRTIRDPSFYGLWCKISIPRVGSLSQSLFKFSKPEFMVHPIFPQIIEKTDYVFLGTTLLAIILEELWANIILGIGFGDNFSEIEWAEVQVREKRHSFLSVWRSFCNYKRVMQVSVLWVRFDCSATTGAAGVVTGISKFVCGRACEGEAIAAFDAYSLYYICDLLSHLPYA